MDGNAGTLSGGQCSDQPGGVMIVLVRCAAPWRLPLHSSRMCRRAPTTIRAARSP